MKFVGCLCEQSDGVNALVRERLFGGEKYILKTHTAGKHEHIAKSRSIVWKRF